MGFDAGSVVEYMVEKYVEFFFWDHTATSSSQEALAFGQLRRMRNVDGQTVPTYRYRITISAHLIWPLLRDEYTRAEKAASSLHIASIVLHELGVSHYLRMLLKSPLTRCCTIVEHAAVHVCRIMLASPRWNFDSRLLGFKYDLTRLSPNILNLLQALGRRLYSSGDFLEDELFVSEVL